MNQILRIGLILKKVFFSGEEGTNDEKGDSQFIFNSGVFDNKVWGQHI